MTHLLSKRVYVEYAILTYQPTGIVAFNSKIIVSLLLQLKLKCFCFPHLSLSLISLFNVLYMEACIGRLVAGFYFFENTSQRLVVAINDCTSLWLLTIVLCDYLFCFEFF